MSGNCFESFRPPTSLRFRCRNGEGHFIYRPDCLPALCRVLGILLGGCTVGLPNQEGSTWVPVPWAAVTWLWEDCAHTGR